VGIRGSWLGGCRWPLLLELFHDDPVWPHAKRVPHEVTHGHLAPCPPRLQGALPGRRRAAWRGGVSSGVKGTGENLRMFNKGSQSERGGMIAWTLRQPSVRQLTRRCPLPPAQAHTTHHTLERGFEADRLTDARWACPAGAGSNLPSLRRVQATSRRRPSSAASRAARSRLRSAHRPETRSSRRRRTARCSTSGPTLAHTDTPRRT
jgi:hypothetical protein